MIGGGERTFISEHDPEGGRKEGGRRSIVTRGDNVERVRCLLKKNPKYAKIHLFDAEGGGCNGQGQAQSGRERER